MIGLLKIS